MEDRDCGLTGSRGTTPVPPVATSIPQSPSARTIRRATAADLEAMIDLAQRSWLSAFATTAPWELIRWWAATDRTRTFYSEHWWHMDLLCAGDELLGLTQVAGAEIHGLWVHPRRQRTGAGSQLLRHAEACVLAAGHRTAWLTCAACNDGALRFYRARGYRDVGRSRIAHASGIELDELRLERALRG